MSAPHEANAPQLAATPSPGRFDTKGHFLRAPTGAGDSSMFLGIDPGTRCGWAVLDAAGGRIASGAWDCSVRRGEGAGFRYIRFERCLRELITAFPRTCVGYEEVRRHMGVDAAHVYGAIRGHLQRLCEEAGIAYCPIPVGTVKKLATGKGNADKDAMVAASLSRWNHIPVDDNEADALWIAEALRTGVA